MSVSGVGRSTTARPREDALKSVGSTLDVLDCFLTDDELGVSEELGDEDLILDGSDDLGDEEDERVEVDD